jgi:hypothetical protein
MVPVDFDVELWLAAGPYVFEFRSSALARVLRRNIGNYFWLCSASERRGSGRGGSCSTLLVAAGEQEAVRLFFGVSSRWLIAMTSGQFPPGRLLLPRGGRRGSPAQKLDKHLSRESALAPKEPASLVIGTALASYGGMPIGFDSKDRRATQASTWLRQQ